MKPSKDQLYDALGELIYAVAFSDGEIQQSEIDKLESVLAQHEWSAAVRWSFDYENSKHQSVEDAYQKALETCKNYGPTEEDASLFTILDEVAEASNGIDANEAALIARFKNELREHFLNLDL